MKCTLEKTEGNRYRDNPDNREMAFATQFHDTAINLFQMSLTDEPVIQFKKTLEILKSQIKSYESN